MDETHSLCICADDFGMSAGVNAAVLDLIDSGTLTATGCLVGREAWRAGLAPLRQADAQRVDVGLHLDLTPPRTPGGGEPGLGPLLARTFSRMASRHALRETIAAQLSRFEDSMGRAPAFVDGHRHVHQFPVVRDVLADEIARRYAASPPWLRSTKPRAGGGGAKARMIHALGGAGLLRVAGKHAIPVSNALLGVYDFSGGARAHGERLIAWLAAARSGDVLMCHPSMGDVRGTPHDKARVAEYALLASLRFPWVTPTGDRVVCVPLSRLAARPQCVAPASACSRA